MNAPFPQPRIYCPQGHDAPKHSVAWSNYEAARLAVPEVRGKALHSEAHRRSLAEWQAGLRASPWPDCDDPTADAAVLGMVKDFTRIVRGHERYEREFGR